MKGETVIDRDSLVTRRSGMVAADLEGEVVMMSLERGNYYALGAVGSRIWELLDAPRTVAALCTELEGTYDVDARTCERDVAEFLRQLEAQDLVVVGR